MSAFGTPALDNNTGSPPEQIVCSPEILLTPVNPFTRIVKVAVSLHPFVLITSTEIIELLVKLNEELAVLKILFEMPVNCCAPST